VTRGATFGRGGKPADIRSHPRLSAPAGLDLLSKPTVTGVTATTATPRVTITGPTPAATIYYVIGPTSGWAPPTAAEVVAGHLSGGGAATASGSEASPIVTTDPFTFASAASGLTASTNYTIAFVWYDGSSGYSNVAISDSFATSAAGTAIYFRSRTTFGARAGSRQAA
jgi:hypothetical protein